MSLKIIYYDAAWAAGAGIVAGAGSSAIRLPTFMASLHR
jgi:hypothetical protein